MNRAEFGDDIFLKLFYYNAYIGSLLVSVGQKTVI